MSILNRDVFNEYNVDYDPVGLRGISLPDSFLTNLNAYEFNMQPQNLNNKGLVSFMDNAGLPKDPYEEFTQTAKPGLNIDFAKQLGSSALGLITGNPFIGLLAKGIGALGDRFSLPGVRGGVNLRGDTGFDTFRRSTSLADFFQRQRDKKARESAARRGEVKNLQSRIDRGDFSGNNADDAPGGAASNQDAQRGGQYG
jgi:hypothetical protein